MMIIIIINAVLQYPFSALTAQDALALSVQPKNMPELCSTYDITFMNVELLAANANANQIKSNTSQSNSTGPSAKTLPTVLLFLCRAKLFCSLLLGLNKI